MSVFLIKPPLFCPSCQASQRSSLQHLGTLQFWFYQNFQQQKKEYRLVHVEQNATSSTSKALMTFLFASRHPFFEQYRTLPSSILSLRLKYFIFQLIYATPKAVRIVTTFLKRVQSDESEEEMHSFFIFIFPQLTKWPCALLYQTGS